MPRKGFNLLKVGISLLLIIVKENLSNVGKTTRESFALQRYESEKEDSRFELLTIESALERFETE